MTTTIEVGTAPASRDFGPLTTEQFVRYSGAAGDLNPMHYDLNFAQKAGYPSVISQGMHSAALLSTFATDWLGAANIRRFQVRFRDIVLPGDVLTCSGEVSAVDAVEGGNKVTVQLTAKRQTGDLAIQGEAEFLVTE